jgi:signal peptidase I
MANLFEVWQARRVRKRTEAEARHVVAEARRILKKKREGIPAAVTAEIEDAVAATESAMRGSDLEALRQAATALDEKMDQHLGFARKSTMREYSESIVVAVAIALLLRAFVIEAFQIPSGSMIPTLEIGDHIFVSKFAYGIGIPFTDKKILALREPHRGDVIVFKYPLGPETDYIKRVVGLPGDRVEVRRNEIFINGRPMPREQATGQPCPDSEGAIHAASETPGDRGCELWVERLDGHVHQTRHESERPPTDFGPKEVPPNNVFVMGDNRDNSNDSRVWGTVPYELIKGKALIVWWSRGPTHDDFSVGHLPSWLGQWFGAIRFRRFFHLVD